jgi:hypothetical protein
MAAARALQRSEDRKRRKTTVTRRNCPCTQRRFHVRGGKEIRKAQVMFSAPFAHR